MAYTATEQLEKITYLYAFGGGVWAALMTTGVDGHGILCPCKNITNKSVDIKKTLFCSIRPGVMQVMSAQGGIA
jgi:hypothetical protein